jgi:uncharacterized protein (DUF427 family)
MKSPGHQKWPEHTVAERQVTQEIEAEAGGQVLANTQDVIRVEEDGSPPRLYFARSAVAMDKLAAWSYEEPHEEHPASEGKGGVL